MNKYLVMALMVSGLVSCGAKDEQYYMSHPEALQQALKGCPEQQSPTMTCDELKALGEKMNNLAYQLQSNPQGFGSKIIALQATIAKQEQQLKEKKDAPDLKESLARNKQDLTRYLVIVKWLESPES